MKRVLPALFIFLMLLVPARALAVVINEFVANATPEWVEFQNTDLANDLLMTYWLDDDAVFVEVDETGSPKFQLSGLNTTNPTYPFVQMTTVLNNTGDSVVLFDASGNVVDQFTYTDAQAAGVSMGRLPDGTGNFVVLESTSQGAPNGTPTPTDVPPTPTGVPPTPTEVPPTPTMEPSPTPTDVPPTPTDVPPTPTLEPTPEPTSQPSPTPTTMPQPTPTDTPPQGEVWESPLITCRLTYSPKVFMGRFRVWWPKLACVRNTGD